MVSNDLSDASRSRAAQDVETPAHHEKEVKGTYHWGRGGEGNMMTIGHGGGNEKTTVPNGHPGKERRGSLQGVVDKGKELLGLKKQAAKHGAESKAAEREEAVAVEE
ncbi:Protein of unknown function (DUF3602) [Teratosphaeria destructans]|uniref:Uncharacterized protein n=1 Tax=Teratosphaeria destructans TaxID=418781 RepID=A0A9W7SHX7_9PEZI|nr:Protein of unknown function (DUF3602) [Teratosphaeria destructans]